MARVRRQQRRSAAGEWVASINRPQRYRRPGRWPDAERAEHAMAQLGTERERERGLRLVRWLTLSGDEALMRRHQLLETLAGVPWPACPRRWPEEPVGTAEGLVRRLLELYPLPPVLRAPFGTARIGRHGRVALARLAAHVGGGGSHAQACDEGLLPPTATRRIYREFLGSSPVGGLHLAWRWPQARALGVPEWAGVAVADRDERTRRRHFWDGDGYWLEVIRWLGRSLQDPTMAAPIVDYLDQHPIDLRGRTAASVLRLVEQWHLTLRQHRNMPSPSDPPFEEQPYATSLELPGWSVKQLLTPMELWLEGQAQQHCVWSYNHRVRQGECSIWSLRHEGVRRLTLEVARTHRVVQIRGHRNRRPSPSEETVVALWAERSGCRL